MEELDYFHGCSYRSGTPQFSVEKQSKARGDQFVIEDLLDLSNEDQEVHGMNGREYGGSEAMTEFSSTASSTVTTVDSSSNFVLGGTDTHFSGELIYRGPADTGLTSDLCEPYDELAELEWLSNFVEDSFSSKDLQKLQLVSAPKSTSSSVASHGDDSTSWAPHQPFPRPEAAVPGKARSKRSRAAPCNWSSRLLLLSSLPMSSPLDPNADVVQSSPCKKSPKEASPAIAGARKCLHCATDKTPQWRIGPLGPKTLCNACGVRFKSGRLVPEYRPAASPTFILSMHSNSHRKVLELRRQKELQQPHFLTHEPATTRFNEAAAFAGDDFVTQHHPRHLI